MIIKENCLLITKSKEIHDDCTDIMYTADCNFNNNRIRIAMCDTEAELKEEIKAFLKCFDNVKHDLIIRDYRKEY